MKIQRTHDKLYLDEYYKANPKEYFKFVCNEMKKDFGGGLETKKELLNIEGNEEEIKDRFYKDLEFGTAGLRGVIGNGTNRMNKYTVTKATQ